MYQFEMQWCKQKGTAYLCLNWSSMLTFTFEHLVYHTIETVHNQWQLPQSGYFYVHKYLINPVGEWRPPFDGRHLHQMKPNCSWRKCVWQTGHEESKKICLVCFGWGMWFVRLVIYLVWHDDGWLFWIAIFDDYASYSKRLTQTRFVIWDWCLILILP